MGSEGKDWKKRGRKKKFRRLSIPPKPVVPKLPPKGLVVVPADPPNIELLVPPKEGVVEDPNNGVEAVLEAEPRLNKSENIGDMSGLFRN